MELWRLSCLFLLLFGGDLLHTAQAQTQNVACFREDICSDDYEVEPDVPILEDPQCCNRGFRAYQIDGQEGCRTCENPSTSGLVTTVAPTTPTTMTTTQVSTTPSTNEPSPTTPVTRPTSSAPPSTSTAQSTTISTTTIEFAVINEAGATSSSGCGGGCIAGIVVGGVILAVVVAGVLTAVGVGLAVKSKKEPFV